MIGFTAVLQVPGLTGPDVDLSLFKLSLQTFPPWFIGIIGATGVLTALVPGSMILIAGATLVANNLVRPFRPGMDDAAHGAAVQAPGAGPGPGLRRLHAARAATRSCSCCSWATIS